MSLSRPVPARLRRGLAAAILATLAILPATGRAGTPASDPGAIRIADRVMDALGGRERWDALRGLRWSFAVAVHDTVGGMPRRHAWDKWTGWHRVEGRTRAAQSFVVVHNLNDGTGAAWVDGTTLEGDSLKKMITLAKSLWTNDSYWLLMPYKLRDPGVTLKSAGEATLDGVVYDKVALSFENVGETPGDHYWVFVNRKNDRVERWEMVLESQQPPPRAYTWEGWVQRGGLWFATAHKDAGGRNVITGDIELVREFPPTVFSAP